MDTKYLLINIDDVDTYSFISTYRTSLDGSRCIIELKNHANDAMTKQEVQVFYLKTTLNGLKILTNSKYKTVEQITAAMIFEFIALLGGGIAAWTKINQEVTL